jgi:glycosyltransferase involved in cell wall biosynthesis
MNILYITNHLNIGGITSYVLSLARGMKKRGHSVYVASSGGQCLSRFRQEGIGYIPIPIKTKKELSPKILASRFKLLAQLKEQRIEIMHVNSRTTQVLGALLNRKSGITCVSTCHGFFKRRFLRLVFPCWGQKIIAISEPVKEHLVKDFKIEDKKIAVIHHGIDMTIYQAPSSGYQAQRKKELGLSAGPVVGIVARLSDVKGHIYLIQAMKDVLKKVPQAQLLMVGEGKEKERLTKLTRRLGMQQNVFLINSAIDTAEVLSAMDIFVLPSLQEGLGLSLMEAMAMGLGAIGSDVGGIRSLIQDGSSGLLVKPRDAVALSAAILELLQNPDKARSLGEQARFFIRNSFSLDKMVLDTERVYSECLSAKY